MILGHRKKNTFYYGLVEKIKKDIAAALKKRGVSVSRVQIFIKTGNINLSFCINKDDVPAILPDNRA